MVPVGLPILRQIRNSKTQCEDAKFRNGRDEQNDRSRCVMRREIAYGKIQLDGTKDKSYAEEGKTGLKSPCPQHKNEVGGDQPHPEKELQEKICWVSIALRDNDCSDDQSEQKNTEPDHFMKS